MDKRVLKTLIAAGVAALATATQPAMAQRNMLVPMMTSFENAYHAGHYREALDLMIKAEEISKTAGLKKGERSVILSNKAEAQRSLGQLKEAEETFKAALKSCEQEPCLLVNFIILPHIYLDLPMIYEAEGRYAEAEGMWLQCEKMTWRNKHFAYYPTNHLAKLYIEWGKLDQAERYVKLAQIGARKEPKSLALPYSHYTTAAYLTAKGQFKEAEAEYVAALTACANSVGKSHPYYAKALVEQSDLFRSESRYKDAEDALNEALKINQTTYSGDHPDTADIMVHLAMVLSEEGRYTEASELVQKALKSEETIYGSTDNLAIAKAKQCQGNILRQYAHYEEAQKLISSALATQRKLLGTDTIESAITMRDLALVEENMGNYKEAESLLKDSLAVIERLTGPEHPERVQAYNALAQIYLANKRYDEAEPLLKASFALSEKVLGDKHAATASSANALGKLYAQQKKYADAETYLQKAMVIDEGIYGPKAPQIIPDLEGLANVFIAEGKAAQAEPLIARSAEIKNVLPGGGITVDVSEPAGADNDRPVTGKWALVVGISNFKDPTINLKYAAKDATDFKNFLINSEKFRADHVKLLTDENADRQNIIDMLGDKWLARHAKPDDLVVVYVSSHGSQSQDDANGTNFLVAHDTNKNSLPATGIPLQWLSGMIQKQVQSNRVVLILDVCHSGSAAQGQGSKGLNKTTDKGIDPKQFKFGVGQMVIASSSADQVSWESKGYENSVFTKCLMEALQTSKDKTTMFQAYKQLKVLVESEVLRDRGDLQTPVLMNKTWKGKDPILAVDVDGASATK